MIGPLRLPMGLAKNAGRDAADNAVPIAPADNRWSITTAG
jgi:hypothetical protein